MKTKAYIPVGTQKSQERKLVEKGDVLKLVSGEEVTFLEIRRTKFMGVMNGRNILVPLYRDRSFTTPYVVSVLNKKDKSVIVKSADFKKFKVGQLFSLEGHKETFMFVGFSNRKANKIEGLDLSSGKRFTIDPGLTFKKIDINKVKKELVNG